MNGRRLVFVGVVLALASVGWGQFDDPFSIVDEQPALQDKTPQSEAMNYIKFKAIASYKQVKPGETLYIAVEMDIAKGWVMYGPVQAPDTVKPASIASSPASGKNWPVEGVAVLWPDTINKPTPWEAGETINVPAYKGKAIAYVKLVVSASAKLGKLPINLIPNGQICGEGCLDIQTSVPYVIKLDELEIGTQSVPNPAWQARPELQAGIAKARTVEQIRSDMAAKTGGVNGDDGADMGFWAALGIALLAGLSLNIMPCVLPVIPIRILGIVEMAGESRRRFVTMGLAFVLGMMLFFAAIAAVNIILKLTLHQSFDINQGFQQPWLIITLSMIVIALAANLFGIFNIIVHKRVVGLDEGIKGKSSGHAKSVGLGFMMAILSTPCSFAFLAAALTYAQTASLLVGTVIILAIGLGMSAPHALLAACPGLVDRLPKPGRWMEIFKQSTGLILLLVAVWLIATLRGDCSARPFWIIAWAVIFVTCLWMCAGWVRYDSPRRVKLLVRLLAVTLAVVTGCYMLPEGDPPLVKPQKFDLQAIEQARSDGRVVMVKFTATWCSKCLQQDYQVFNTKPVAEAIEELDVAYFKGDVSTAKTPAARWMKRNGYGVKIPMTLIYPPKGPQQPPIRSELTADMLVERLRQAAGTGQTSKSGP